ncbi:unnamed protein product [Merluccius merluccius]
MPRLEEVANVALRVPSVLVLDLLYRCDVDGVTEHIRARNDDMLFKYKYAIWNMYYLGHLVNVCVLVLPLRHIVTLYLHILAALLLYVGHQISKDYVHEEVRKGYGGALYLDSAAFNRFVSALTSLIILNTLCAFLVKTRRVWLFSAHLLPLLARLCAAPPDTLLLVSSSSVVLTGVGVAVFLLSNLFVPYRLARAAYSELLQMEVVELYRLVAVAMSLWNQFAVPVLFSVFWMVLFVVQLGSDIMAARAASTHQGVLFLLLSSVSECCATPYSLLGLTFVVSYLAMGLLNLCKFYLGGYAAVLNENVMHRGVTEGVTLFLLALQTGLLDMQALQRTFLLSIILFIVLTSTLQSMIEITDPVILALGASRNRCLWKHLRGLSMCLLLLVFPGFMAYKISQFFHMDFWLLILVSSCMLTSLQVTGTLLIYSLFMVELLCRQPMESLDEVIYWVNGASRVLEFGVALCVVAYGAWESLFGEWSWMGASVIIIHSYFNVWLRAQSGWRSFLLRQEAAKKISSLPRATAAQLQRHNDVCSICFQNPHGPHAVLQVTPAHLLSVGPAAMDPAGRERPLRLRLLLLLLLSLLLPLAAAARLTPAASPQRAAAGHESQVFLDQILRFYRENSSITRPDFENLVHLTARGSPEEITEGNPLENVDCPSVAQILLHYGLGNQSHLTAAHLDRLCPAVLTQVLLPSCLLDPAPEDPLPADYTVWGYGFLAVTIINLASLFGLMLIPFTHKPYFPKVLTYFIGLAIGTLFSNAVLQLIPEALGFDPKSDNYVHNAVGIFGGFYLLYFMEKILKMALGMDHEHGHSHFPAGDALPDGVLQNGEVAEKRDRIILTSVSTVALEKSGQTPDGHLDTPSHQEVPVTCRWLRGPRIADIKTLAWMITLSDALHNFIDGLAIGASFTVSVMTGFSTSIAIVCEEFPHELGDFVILLNSGMSIPQAIFFNLLSAMSCYVGLVFGILVGSTFAPNAIFAIAGGMFLYIALADMFPEMNSIMAAQERTSSKIVFFLIQNLGLLSGFTIILLITLYAGQISLD